MIKLFIGGKGSGKTMALIELVNNAANTSAGSVVCIEKGNKLKLDITYKARLIDSDNYSISSAEALFGFISGILASNNDITDIFVDGTLKICDVDGTVRLVITIGYAKDDDKLRDKKRKEISDLIKIVE